MTQTPENTPAADENSEALRRQLVDRAVASAMAADQLLLFVVVTRDGDGTAVNAHAMEGLGQEYCAQLMRHVADQWDPDPDAEVTATQIG